ncbi:hypothetical protein [Diaphorobacter caeni]|uniref:hypothetical protein n=1 Tax=Diaphorobacter caeni TaxID=2784387 RepID=UPI00188EDF2F|nr:hypothetical protein [Diaphorobacter caeni]MBF5006865.1 hypothetical protein [Diaphorobacter caeni]
MSKAPKIHTIQSLLARTVEEGSCRLWTGYLANGVPQVHHGGKMVPVRRLLLTLAGIDCSAAAFVPCNCGNSSCVEPKHIVQLSFRHHMSAMARTSNAGAVKQIRIAKLTQTRRASSRIGSVTVAREIAISAESGPVLAKRYGVSRSTINNIKRGTAWAAGANPFAGLLGGAR